MPQHYGKVKPGRTLEFYFDSFDGGTGASITMTGIAVGDIEIYKDGVATTRASTSGYTLLDSDGIDFGSITGIHGFSVDLADNGTDEFYQGGHRYVVVVASVTVDGQTVNFIAGSFNIGYEGSILDTAIATLASQTSFVIDTGPAEASALVGCVALIHDQASEVQIAIGVVSAYAVTSKTVTLAVDPAIFTMAAEDNLSFFRPDNMQFVAGTVQTPGDLAALIGAVGSSAGGGANFAAEHDNTITDTIDNAAAVNKGSGLVGIPVTGHAFVVDNQVTIASTTNYNGSFDIISQTTNEVVITSAFVSETFGGSETIISTIKTIAFVGSQTNTFLDTAAEQNTRHIIDDATNLFDIIYQFKSSGGRLAIKLTWKGFLTAGNDNALIQAYDFIGNDWETIRIIAGTGGGNPSNIELDIPLLVKHTGTVGLDFERVFIRIKDDGSATNPQLNTDQILVEAVAVITTVYQDGAIWIDTNSSNTGTEIFVDGTSNRPVNSLANAIILAAKFTTPLTRFQVVTGSTITFAEAHTQEVWNGDGWTLALGGRDISNIHVDGPDVTGTGTSTTGEAQFSHCLLGAVTMPAGTHVFETQIEGKQTMGAAGAYFYSGSAHASSTRPVFDFGALGASTLHLHPYNGGFELQNMATGDVVHLNGDGFYTINSNCSGGTINVAGHWGKTDNSGNVTINEDPVFTDDKLNHGYTDMG